MPAISTTTPKGRVQRKHESSVPPVAAVRGPSFTRGMDTEGGRSFLLLLLALTVTEGHSGTVMVCFRVSSGIAVSTVSPSVGYTFRSRELRTKTLDFSSDNKRIVNHHKTELISNFNGKLNHDTTGICTVRLWLSVPGKGSAWLQTVAETHHNWLALRWNTDFFQTNDISYIRTSTMCPDAASRKLSYISVIVTQDQL